MADSKKQNNDNAEETKSLVKEKPNMKSTGIIRKVDELGRVVIPKEIRVLFNIAEKDPLEIYVDGGAIVLKKHNPNCILCGDEEDLIKYNDHLICRKCQENIKQI